MKFLFLEASGPAPPDVCWMRYALPMNWPSWAPQIRAVTIDPESAPRTADPHPAARAGRARGGWAPAGGGGEPVRIRPGLRGRVHSYPPLSPRFTVTAVDETDRTWSWQVSIGRLQVTLDHGVDACLDGGTCAWLRISGPRPVLYAYAPLARAALRRLVS